MQAIAFNAAENAQARTFGTELLERMELAPAFSRDGAKSAGKPPHSKSFALSAMVSIFLSDFMPRGATKDDNGDWHWRRAAFPGCRFWRLSSRQFRREGRLESLPSRQTRTSALQAGWAAWAIFWSAAGEKRPNGQHPRCAPTPHCE
jgi:hypothetical protein